MTGKKIWARGGFMMTSLLLLALIVIANFLVARHPFRLDLTSDKEFTLSQATRNILKKLDDQVVIKLFFTKDIPAYLTPLHQQINDFLNEYKNTAKGKISVQTVVPEASPENEQEAQMMGIPPLQLNVLEKDKREVRKVYLGAVLFYGGKKEILPVISDIKNLEYDLTSALFKLTTAKLPKVGLVLAGVDQPQDQSYEVLQKVLSEQVNLQTFSFSEEDFSAKELDALMVVEPNQVSEKFAGSLAKLFEEGVPLVILSGRIKVDPMLSASSYLTGLEEWLGQLGVEISDQVVVDPKSHGHASFSNNFVQYFLPYPFFVKVISEGFNRENPVTNQLEEVVFPWANSIILDEKKPASVKYEVLAESTESGMEVTATPAVTPDRLQNLEMGPTDKKIIALSVKKERGEEKSPSQLLLVANNHFVQNRFLNDQEANILLVQNMVDWISHGEELIGIRSRGKTSAPLKISSHEAIALIRWLHLLGVPLLIAVLGLLVNFMRNRRYRKLSHA